MQGKIREFRSSERLGIIKTSLAPLAIFLTLFAETHYNFSKMENKSLKSEKTPRDSFHNVP
jgi:hypothetical protein